MPYLKIFLVSMTPIGELRAGIPLGIFAYHLPWYKVFFFALLGNIFAVFILLLFLEKVSSIIEEKASFLNLWWQQIIQLNYKRHQRKFRILGSLALITLVAIPLPFTGGWTGVLSAFIFRVKFWQAFFLISLGVLIAGLIVSGICLEIV